MTGWIRPILDLLSLEWRATYAGHSCGICAATRSIYGHRATLGHSNEMVFISLLLEGLAAEPYGRRRKGCTAFPLLPRKVVEAPPRHARAVAAGVLATLQLDLKDAREDGERRIKRVLCVPHRTWKGEIDPDGAWREPFVQAALRGYSDDRAAIAVAGVIGSVFSLAGAGQGPSVAGCRIGHALGRLMGLLDAAEDREADLRAGRTGLLDRFGHPPKVTELEDELHAIVDEILELAMGLPLRRNGELVMSLLDLHVRARIGTAMARLGRTVGGTGVTTVRGKGGEGCLRDERLSLSPVAPSV
jgi:hypothetical protein